MVAEAIIRKTCKELDIEVIDMSVSPDHIPYLFQNLQNAIMEVLSMAGESLD